jgi:hypothetical protein
MRLDEMLTLIEQSKPSDWTPVYCGSAGPSYHDRLQSTIAEKRVQVEVESHDTIGVYRPEIDLTIAYGMSSERHAQPLQIEWAEKNGWGETFVNYCDTFWRGQLVHRISYYEVDSGRCGIPVPTLHFTDKGDTTAEPEVSGRTVTGLQYQYGRLMHDLRAAATAVDEFDRYFKATGFTVDG